MLMLVFGAAVVINRNPIASALSLVICFMGLSALFMSLDAFFIGIIQTIDESRHDLGIADAIVSIAELAESGTSLTGIASRL